MSRIFGPVPSRRLGRSLGIDIVPYKTCTFDCVYCECGKTTDLTCERREFYPLDELLDAAAERIASLREPPDHLTLSGAGEPTLYSRMGELIDGLGKRSEAPVAVITNGSLLGDPAVRAELMRADVVLPSLDAATDEVFQRINRPHPDCRIASVIDGLERFVGEYRGRVLLEILVVEGLNDGANHLDALAAIVRRLPVEAVQINTAVRPGTEPGIGPIAAGELERIRLLFGSTAEVVASAGVRAGIEDAAAAETIIDLIARRPCTAADIHRALGTPLPGVVKILAALETGGRVVSSAHGGETWYTATKRADRDNQE
ncbi:MAG: radical SAM protein [Candidatus Krumholzibacteriota bacterium]|nr:radical SAM protein [Candidatus Krumholzibacteriota bacterium]